MLRTLIGSLIGLLLGAGLAALVLRITVLIVQTHVRPLAINHDAIYLGIILGACFGSLVGALVGLASLLVHYLGRQVRSVSDRRIQAQVADAPGHPDAPSSS